MRTPGGETVIGAGLLTPPLPGGTTTEPGRGSTRRDERALPRGDATQPRRPRGFADTCPRYAPVMSQDRKGSADTFPRDEPDALQPQRGRTDDESDDRDENRPQGPPDSGTSSRTPSTSETTPPEEEP
ncbi:hypothetical protein PSU4_23570 [Pseudonocardia sulfidoxydans NBRC 16205]|uniref:Uncharacterized protein n=2 Tax=Pseudonocardia sulfidoxydans TaxID=54011 RepID=A0A511DG86_9PSEU|nr:hypothetical protein PSU4_23570 [Pseudonocardia sulfidoxydans NBRC 16205]